MQNEDKYIQFGFKFSKGSTHTRRTIMLNELRMILDTVKDAESVKDYYTAAEEDNCLRKRTANSRKYSIQYLMQLYSLDKDVILFKALLYFWSRDIESQPLIAMLCAMARDSLLRETSKFITNMSINSLFSKEEMESYIDSLEPGRFSEKTLQSTTRNISSSWSQSGHLKGNTNKIRNIVEATPASVAYALFLGYLLEIRGTELFETDFIKILDCSKERLMELAEIASRKGWIIFKRIDNVIEVLFPNLVGLGGGF